MAVNISTVAMWPCGLVVSVLVYVSDGFSAECLTAAQNGKLRGFLLIIAGLAALVPTVNSAGTMIRSNARHIDGKRERW